MTMHAVPDSRIQRCNAGAVDGSGSYVLYWMIAARRRHWNFALQRAVHWAAELRKPLVILEPLNCGYPWASARLHTALIQGMRDNRADFAGSAALYCPFVERASGEGRGLIHALSQRACIIVTDDFPAFEIPRWIAGVAATSRVLVEKIDSNGLLPMRSTDRVFTTAFSFRRFLQSALPAELSAFPMRDALAGVELPECGVPEPLRGRWQTATADELESPEVLVKSLPLDSSVSPVAAFAAGPHAGRSRLKEFVRNRLPQYADSRNQPEAEGTSGLSPYLHFGHVSAHEVFEEVARTTQWSVDKLATRATGSREGWWNAGADADAFLDQLVTWREIGFNMCAHSNDATSYRSLPEWARRTLDKHASDQRSYVYSAAQFEQAATHDALWNAAQIQLVQDGHIHNYLRMLWGKKILEWSPTPESALATMIHLNNKYAFDGRDPNSYSGIFWILGRYDRPWAPERPIFGSIRYMSSANTARKLRVKDYMKRYSREYVL